MKTIRERVENLSEEKLRSLKGAVQKFNCLLVDCYDCPFCDSDGNCIGVLADVQLYEIYRNR